MKTIAWFLVLGVGFGLMLLAYEAFIRIADPGPWTTAFLYVSDDEPGPEAEGLTVAAARVRRLPLPKRSMVVADALQSGNPQAGRFIDEALGEKVFLLPGLRDVFGPDVLADGRLPAPGAAEVLAGAQAAHPDEVRIGDQTLRVVGVLDRSVVVFARSYLLGSDAAGADLFDLPNPDVERAYVVRLPREALRQEDVRQRLEAAFPEDRFTPLTGDLRVGGGPLALYLGGMAMMFLGGAALFVRLFRWMGRTVTNRVLGPPLVALDRWWGLLAGLNALVFGTYLLAAVAAYVVPEMQSILLAGVVQEIQSGSGPLALAGQGYATGNVLWAAGATLGVNFVVGSVAVITVPSVVLPGVGVLVAWFRSGVLGLMLAPTSWRMAGTMLPHSFTVLVELEAYIVAAFFVVLIPVYLFRRSEGPSVLGRWSKALLLNLQAQILVFVILAIVAVYEATEVLLLVKYG